MEAGRAWGKSIGEQETGWAATVESKLDREEHFIFVEESKAGNWGAKILLKGLQTSGSLAHVPSLNQDFLWHRNKAG